MSDPAKRYELTFEQRVDYLYAHVKAMRIDRELAVNYLQEVAKACAEFSADRVLVYREIPAVPDTPTMFFLANYLLEVMPGIRTAFVNPFSSIRDTLKFGIEVSANRGGTYAVFNTIEEAEEWLRS